MMPGKNPNTDWRKVASAIYKKPADAKVFGSAELDVTDLEKYIFKKRRQGLKVTMTHIFALILSRGLREEVPELNCFVRRGNIIERKQVDAMVSILMSDGSMSSVKIENADTLNLYECAEELAKSIKNTRAGDESRAMQMKELVGKIPWPIRTWFFNLIKFLTIKWGVSIPSAGLSDNNFGSFVLTNIGSVGLDTGYPAMFPISNVAFVFVIGKAEKKPVVIDDKIVIRKIMTISSAMDHRIADAMHGGKMFRYIKKMIRKPELLEKKPVK
ncbi:MAG: 2-oxo acid dehydrogenase subunit E2 [Bacteroidales bacterium]|nr:2-oxo acid dehydrogenase subunit E2 [Bacteroidales bacterium]